MKSLIAVLLVALFAFSCQENDGPIGQFPQTWKIAGWQIMGDAGDSGFQSVTDSSYTYLFKNDGSFLKTVGIETTSGTFKKEELIFEVGGKRTIYTLFFPEGRLTNSCSANVEGMFIDENILLVGGSAACDGPTNFFSLLE